MGRLIDPGREPHLCDCPEDTTGLLPDAMWECGCGHRWQWAGPDIGWVPWATPEPQPTGLLGFLRGFR